MCVEVLGQLSYADDETADVIGQAWYYACCMDLMLEAGKLFSLYNFFISCRCWIYFPDNMDFCLKY